MYSMITLKFHMANVTRKKKGQYHHGDLREALIRAAIELVAPADEDAQDWNFPARLVRRQSVAPPAAKN